MTEPQAQTPTLASQRTIWRALLASIALYALLPWFTQPRLHGDPESARVLLLSLTLIAVATAIGTLVAREILLVRPIRRGELRVSTPEGAAKLFQLALILWALSESVGIYGIVVFFLCGEAQYANLFFLASAALLFAHRLERVPREAYE